MPVILLPRFDSHRQPVLLGRQGARGIGRERTGRVVGLVEVQHDLVAARQVRIQEPACAVGLFAAGLVAKDEEQARGGRFENRIKAQFLAVQAEHDVSGAGHRLGLAQHVGDGDFARLGDEPGGDAVLFARGEIVETVEIAAGLAGRVPHPDAVLSWQSRHTATELPLDATFRSDPTGWSYSGFAAFLLRAGLAGDTTEHGFALVGNSIMRRGTVSMKGSLVKDSALRPLHVTVLPGSTLPGPRILTLSMPRKNGRLGTAVDRSVTLR